MNIGSVTQLVLEGAPTSEIRDFVEFTTRVGLPNTLTEVGLRADDLDSLKTVADAATVEGETIHAMPFEVRSADVVSALAIDRAVFDPDAAGGAPAGAGALRRAPLTGSRAAPIAEGAAGGPRHGANVVSGTTATSRSSGPVRSASVGTTSSRT